MPLSAFQQFCADTGCPCSPQVMALWTQRNDAVAANLQHYNEAIEQRERAERAEIERDNLKAEREMFVPSELHDKGPWTCSPDGRSIESDDFTHDVMLKVTGDFFSDEQRYAYSRNLADKLNAHPPVQDGKVFSVFVEDEFVGSFWQGSFSTRAKAQEWIDKQNGIGEIDGVLSIFEHDLDAMLKAAQQGE